MADQKMHEKVRAYVTAHNISQKIIALGMGVSESRVSLILSGKRRMTADDFLEMCRAMDADPRVFFETDISEGGETNEKEGKKILPPTS